MINSKKLTKPKCFLFVDGTNLYAAQYELFGPDRFLNFPSLIETIEERLKIKFERIYFYASFSPKSKNPSRREKQYLKNEAIFYKNVITDRRVAFFKGYRSKTSGKEKEVDVKLTADLISYAFLDKYSQAYLFSGDADFLQALFAIEKFHNNKKLNLVCMENKIMYQGLFYFDTNILVFSKEPIFRRIFKKLKILKIDKDRVVRSV